MMELGDMMKQARQMQENMRQAQEELAATEVRGEAGAGMVAVTMTAKFEVKRVEIDPSLLSGDQKVLEELVAAAVTDANRRAEKAGREKMAQAATALGLPPGLKLPF